MCTATIGTSNVHPFQETIKGSVGPYSFIGLLDFKEATAEELRHFGVTIGFCDHCGRSIRYNCVIEDSNGKRFVVGTSCVAKTGDRRVGTPMEVAMKALQRKIREEKKRAKHEAYMNEVMPSGKTRREESEERFQKMADEAAREREQMKIRFNEKWGEVMDVLDNTRGGFAASVLEGLESGIPPFGRGKDICFDIYAKAQAKAGVSTYEDAYAYIAEKVG